MTFLTELLSKPGLSAKHSWRGGQVVFGDNQGTLPRYKLRKIAGYYSTADLDDNRRRKFGQVGERPTPGGVGGKTLTYSGTVQANTLDELEYMSNLLQHAAGSDPQLGEAAMTISRVRAGGHSYQFTGRLVQCELDDEQEHGGQDMPTPWQRNFVVAFRLGDPRIYVTDAQYQTDSSAGNGANDPFLNVSNAGAYDAIPVIRIYGPCVAPRISRPGATIACTFTLTGAEWADVNFATRTITKNTGADLSHQRDVAASSWWDAGQEGIPGGAPGPTATVLTLTTAAGHPGVASKFRVTFLPAV